MIDGVTILNETTKWTSGGWSIFLGIFFGLLAILMLIFLVWSIMDREIGACAASIFFFIGCVLISIFGFYIHTKNKSYEEYQVIISDSVKMNEFNAKYDIVSQDGKIYTIVKKGDE